MKMGTRWSSEIYRMWCQLYSSDAGTVWSGHDDQKHGFTVDELALVMVAAFDTHPEAGE
ncbi:hypothetical protein ACLB1M_12600 [Escherichia coli]